MAPKQSTTAARGRPASGSAGTKRPSEANSGSASKAKRTPAATSSSSTAAARANKQTGRSSNSRMDRSDDNQSAEDDGMDVDMEAHVASEDGDEDEDEEQKTIPPELLTRLLHEFFEKDGTRISRDANAAVAKYMDVFVREAIARTAVEKGSGFLEVEDLEKVAPQLLLDL
ncbi:CENP-S associating centromere protein X-domain-containing protein [Xylariaceae sp. FL0016]|nr:CENP-S associating centromere protein X-domain-containing protein [Xylariaceae sp. FL0016]